MSARIAVATAVAASVCALALPAFSADLDYPPQYGSDYGERYYAGANEDQQPPYEGNEAPEEAYEPAYQQHPAPRGKGFAEPPYAQGPIPRGKGFAEPVYVAPRYVERVDVVCVPRRVVRRRLRLQGWKGFRNFEPRGPVILMNARRRGTGRPFALAVDRCSGEILSARPLYGPRLAPVAGGPPRRWPAPY